MGESCIKGGQHVCSYSVQSVHCSRVSEGVASTEARRMFLFNFKLK